MIANRKRQSAIEVRECNKNSKSLPRWEAAPAAEALTANLEAVRNAYIVGRGREE